MERQRELADSLIKYVSGDVGFSQGKPVAAFTMYKCLLHWKSFEAERTNVFDRLIQLIGSAIENNENKSHLSYWLSNTSTLLFLIQRSIKAGATWKPPQPTSFFGRMAQGFRSSPSSANLQLDIVRPVEAKYPALLFKQQLTAYVEKIFAILRDNFKKELTPLLSSCVRAPKTPDGAASEGSDPNNPWQSLIDSLNSFLNTLKENHVPRVLAQKIFTQTFSFINVQLFNSLLLHRECCTLSNAEYVKTGLGNLEEWCGQATEEFAGTSWEELKHIRQAIGFLVMDQKSSITYDDITNNICPVLSVHQLYRICTIYSDDKNNSDDNNTSSVSPDVISNIKALMGGDKENETNDDAANSNFSLDDNSSIPISVDEMSATGDEKDFAGVKAPAELCEHPDFTFLQD